VHRQGILFGYVSRVYEQHPVVPCDFWKADEPAPDLLVNGAPGDCRRRLGALLAEAGYRYVVWHKPDFAGYPAGSWPELRSRQTLDLVAGNRAPDYEDEQVRVFDLSQGVRRAAPDVSLDVAEHWYAIDQGGRWATSPARLRIYSDRPRRARLELRPSLLFSGEPPGKSPLGETGVLVIRAGDGAEQSLQLEVGREAAVELRLEPGYQTVELRLLAGGFVPADYGLSDRRVLSFAMSSLNLRTLD
jgi:hypothetical protein